MKIFGIPEKDSKEGRETWEESEEKIKSMIFLEPLSLEPSSIEPCSLEPSLVN